MELRITRNATMLYTTTADGRVGNAFTLHIENRDRSPREFQLALADSERFELVAGLNPIPVPAVVWLFGSGLPGLVGMARGRRS